MYKTILVPLDGSKRAEAIIPHVVDVARCHQARVVLLQVVEPARAAPGPHTSRPDDNPMLLDQCLEYTRVYLAGWKGHFREMGLPASASAELGPIVNTILDVAAREDADLIAMASHGRSGLAQVFYGSVAAGVLHRIDRPLLLIRSQTGD